MSKIRCLCDIKIQNLLAMEEGKDSNTTVVVRSRGLAQRLTQLPSMFLVFCFSISLFIIYMIRKTGDTTPVATPVSILQPCVQEPPVNTLDHWIKSPSKLEHKMSDKELLWRASFVPQLKTYPFDRVPKIAFMFLTKGPLPLALLWERFFKGHEGLYSIYIHSLPSYQPDFPPTSVFYDRQIPSQVAEWGRMSMCDAERRLLANALLHISNQRFVLLSESCIPLYNFTLTYNYIINSRYSFMGAFDDPGPVGRGRYHPNMFPQVQISQWRKASQWFEVDRKLAYIIISDVTYYPKFAEFCRPDCYVDEHYFPTLLNIQAPDSIANRSLTWVDWSRGGPHPATFGNPDITHHFMNRLYQNHPCHYNGKPSSICYLFARKFSPSTLEPLFLLAPKFLGY